MSCIALTFLVCIADLACKITPAPPPPPPPPPDVPTKMCDNMLNKNKCRGYLGVYANKDATCFYFIFCSSFVHIHVEGLSYILVNYAFLLYIYKVTQFDIEDLMIDINFTTILQKLKKKMSQMNLCEQSTGK